MVMQRVNHPNGNLKSMGYFLQCNGDSDLASWTCSATAELRIISQKEGIDDMSRSKLTFHSISMVICHSPTGILTPFFLPSHTFLSHRNHSHVLRKRK